MDESQYEGDPRGYALDLIDVGGVSDRLMVEILLTYMSHDDVRGALDANELSPRFGLDDLADEFEENALGDVAENLREHGVEATREWIEDKIEEVEAGNDPFDPDGMSLHNLEVARDRLARV